MMWLESLPPATRCRRRWSKRTGGVPLFVEELTRLLFLQKGAGLALATHG